MTIPKLNVGAKAAKTVNVGLNVVGKKLENNCIFVGLIIFNALVFAALLFLNFLAGDPALSKGLFNHSVGNISAEFPVNITPAGWAFSIWGVIYLFQLAWVIYSLALICRNTEDGPAYLNPVVLSPTFFIFFTLSSAFNIGWLFLWDRLLFLAAFVFLLCIALSLLLSLSISSSRTFMYSSNLIDQGRRSEVTFIQAVLINGIAMYMTWTFIATLINMTVVLVYKWYQPLSVENASIIALAILAVLVVIYVALDTTVLEKYTKYTITPYLTVIWALSAILAKNYDPDQISSIMSAVLLGAVSLAGVIKLGITIYRTTRGNFQYQPMKMGRKPLHSGQ